MQFVYSLLFSLLPLTTPHPIDNSGPEIGYISGSHTFHYNLLFNEEKQLIRYANRFEQAQMGTYIRNTQITGRDLSRIVQIINQKDLFRGGLNDQFSPGVGSNGVKLKKRTQDLMYDLDPNTPNSEDIDKIDVPNSTRGYSTTAFVNFKGLMVDDTILLFYNSGTGSATNYEKFIVNAEMLGNGGSSQFEINLGEDANTSSSLGVHVAFADSEAESRFDTGTMSYSIEIERTVEIRKPPSGKPVSRRRVRRRN